MALGETRMKRVITFISILLGGTGSEVSAQFLLGQTGSNYAGIHGVYANPASAVDSRYKVHVHLAGYENYLYNNYLVWEAPYSPVAMLTNTVSSKYRGPSKGIIFRDQEYLREKLNGRDKHLRAGGEVRGPGVLITLNEKNAFSFNTRIRAGAAVTHASQSVAQLIKNGTTIGRSIEPEDFGTHVYANTNGMVELSGSYARVMYDEDEDFVKVGVTVKRVIGLHQGHILGRNIDYEYVQDPTYATEAAVRLKSVDAQYGITNEGAFQSISFSPVWLLGNAPAGSGWGADLGMVYEYRPDVRKYSYRDRYGVHRDASKNKYLYRISVSLLDIGRILYKNPNYVEAYKLQRRDAILAEDNFTGMQGIDGFMLGLNQTLNPSESERIASYRTALPTRLQASIDYNVKEKVYVNAMLMQGFVSNKRAAFTMPSVLAVTPRYEGKWVEVAMPIALTDNYSRLALGLGARLGILYFGSDNLLSTLNIGNPKGIEFYFGAQIPIYQKAPESNLKCYPQREKRGLFGFLKKK